MLAQVVEPATDFGPQLPEANVPIAHAPHVSGRMWVGLVGAATVALALRLLLLNRTYHTFVDDAYIFLRYAANAASGKGLVYNAGERVQGFTSPLFTLLLAALGKIVGADHLVGANEALQAVLFMVATGVLGHIALRRHSAGWIFLVGWLLWFPFVDAGINGMETLLFIALSYAAVNAVVEERDNEAAVLLALVMLTRPEGTILSILLIAGAIRAGRRRVPWFGTGVALGIIGAWLWAALVLYGSIVPQSLRAKVGASGGIGKPLSIAESLVLGISSSEVANLHGWVGAISAVATALLVGTTIAGLALYVRQRSALAAVAAFPLCTWIAYVLGDPVRIWSWYAVPTALAVWWTASDLLGRAVRRVPAERRVYAAALALGAAAVVGCVSLPFGIHRREKSFEASTTELRAVASTIRTSKPNARSIAIGDIGVVGWDTQARIIDLNALVTPLGRDNSPADVVGRFRPDVVVLLVNFETQPLIDLLVGRRPPRDADEVALPRYQVAPLVGAARIVLIQCPSDPSDECGPGLGP